LGVVNTREINLSLVHQRGTKRKMRLILCLESLQTSMVTNVMCQDYGCGPGWWHLSCMKMWMLLQTFLRSTYPKETKTW